MFARGQGIQVSIGNMRGYTYPPHPKRSLRGGGGEVFRYANSPKRPHVLVFSYWFPALPDTL